MREVGRAETHLVCHSLGFVESIPHYNLLMAYHGGDFSWKEGRMPGVAIDCEKIRGVVNWILAGLYICKGI